jgi:hypothetical protein
MGAIYDLAVNILAAILIFVFGWSWRRLVKRYRSRRARAFWEVARGEPSGSIGMGPCGIPSTWRSPTARRPGGSPRRDWRRSRGTLPLGRRVVALGEVDGMPHPVHPGPVPPCLWTAIPEACPPGKGIFF